MDNNFVLRLKEHIYSISPGDNALVDLICLASDNLIHLGEDKMLHYQTHLLNTKTTQELLDTVQDICADINITI